jgi:thymidylate synthase (FAD)
MNRVQLLDRGYLEVVEHWGSEERIIEAARMSTGKGFQGWGKVETCENCKGTGREPGYGPNHNCRTCGGDMSPHGRGLRINKPGDEKLLRYLHENAHSTPFEMAGMIIEVKAPIMVFREWHRHRTQSYNEMSARYTPLPDDNYVPTVERCMVVAGTNKQANAAAGADELTHESALEWLEELASVYAHCERVYQSGLRRGIPKELARLPVPVGRYSRMRASTCLRNWLSFMTLRSAPRAQYEIRVFANALHDALRLVYPRTIGFFDEGMRKQS